MVTSQFDLLLISQIAWGKKNLLFVYLELPLSFCGQFTQYQGYMVLSATQQLTTFYCACNMSNKFYICVLHLPNCISQFVLHPSHQFTFPFVSTIVEVLMFNHVN